MANYVQASELGKYFPESRIIDLADGDTGTETLATLTAGTQARLEERIANAEAEADSYLQGRFALPISPAPERLKLAVGKMALFYLYEDKPEQYRDGNPMAKQYEIHREWLEGVKEEEMYIGSAAVTADTDDVYSTAEDAGGGGLIFGGGGLNDY